jgi:CMP-N-acetylneuraminic acid synthetase
LQKILGWIPARSNSKGVPGKNQRVLGNQPLVVHTILAAQRAACLDRIVVSTDDPEIARMALGVRAEVPWIRPAELATDQSPVTDSAVYDLDRLGVEQNYLPDAVLLLQPTSPFRTPQTIHAAVEMFAQSGGESVVSVSAAREHPHWSKRIAEDGSLEAFLPDVPSAVHRQELAPVYCLNGVLYLASVENILSKRSFHSPRTRALVISSEKEALDIDTPFDWLVAEALWTFSGAGQSAGGSAGGSAKESAGKIA